MRVSISLVKNYRYISIIPNTLVITLNNFVIYKNSIDFVPKFVLLFFVLVCHKGGIQPVAIFGPQDAIADGAVRDQCAIVQIPHIQAAWQPYDPDLEQITQPEEEVIDGTPPEKPSLDNEEPNTVEGVEQDEETEVEEEAPTFKKITINFFPDSDEISTAYVNLLKHYQWESFGILYEDEFGKFDLFKTHH